MREGRPTKKLHVKTYGCQMNVYDSARMTDLLAPLGYVPTASADDADMVILNTCHIREKAAEKVFSELGRLKQIKEDRASQGLNTLIAVAGCVAQAEGEEIVRRQKAVDIVVGPQSYHRLPEMIARVTRHAGHSLETEFPAEEKFDTLSRDASVDGVAAFLTVQEGCDKFCTFCVVPYTRGAEYSRPIGQIEDEAQRLVNKGVREITLLGQNVNAYCGKHRNGERGNLAFLIERLSRIDGLSRIRYTTSHPRDMSDDLIAAHRDIEQLMPYLHLPVQSGSNRILHEMNRGHSRDEYLRLIEKIRNARSDIALSSDFIVGFPGETDRDFEDTLALVGDVGYASAFSFKYSPRPGTPAASMAKPVPADVSDHRLSRLQALLGKQQQTFNGACLNRVMPVLLEKTGRKKDQAIGRSPYLQSVNVENADHLIGEIITVQIEGVFPNSLNAKLAGGRAPSQPVLQLQ